jgi:MOSC domain-containing protein YiiM
MRVVEAGDVRPGDAVEVLTRASVPKAESA